MNKKEMLYNLYTRGETNMNFGNERTHILMNELEQMFSPDFQV